MSQGCNDGKEMYKIAWCTCKFVVLSIKTFYFFAVLLPSPSSLILSSSRNSAIMETWRHTSLSIEHASCYDVCLMKFNDIFLDDIFLMYDIIVFEILGIHTYTCKRKAGVFKNLNSGELFWKKAFSVTVFTGHEWTVGQTGEKNLRLKKKRIRVDGAWTCYLFCRSCLCRSLRYLSLVFTSTLKRKHRHKKNGHVYFSRAYAYAYIVAFSD